MRNEHYLVAFGTLLAWVVLPAGCAYDYNLKNCNDYPMPGCRGVAAPDGGTDSGTDSRPPPSCLPSQTAGAVADTCGVFVSSSQGSDTTGMGTREAPYKTLTKAVSVAGTKPVYACAGATPFSETLMVPAGATIFGGLDCSSWSYVGATTKTTLAIGAVTYALFPAPKSGKGGGVRVLPLVGLSGGGMALAGEW